MAPYLTGIDNCRVFRRVLWPMLFGGVVAPSRFSWPRLVRRDAFRAAHRTLRAVRAKYGPRVQGRFCGFSPWLVLDGGAIDSILRAGMDTAEVAAGDGAGALGADPQPNNTADPFIKKRPASRFTPSGVIVSRGEKWSVRRPFNTEVLALGHRHPDAATFLSVVDHEIEHLSAGALATPRVLAWDDLSRLGARISQGMIFGRGTFDEDFDRHLARLVSWSNLFFRRPCHFARFTRHIQDGLARASGASLMCGAASRMAREPAPPGVALEPVSQAAFWCFVLKDAIELHTSRTLALITVAPQKVRTRLMEEVRPESSPDAIDRMVLLDACIKEQLRLWTAVPVLARIAAEDFDLDDGTTIRRGEKLLLQTGFYHRDPEVFGPDADRFAPERLLENCVHPPVYVFSRHRQSCAGQSLAIFILKAVLAAILRRGTVESLAPAIDINNVPAAIDHFRLRFWWRRHL